MHAVIILGGHQYRVSEGDRVVVDRLPAAVGETVRLQDVALLSADGKREVGLPIVEGAVVEARVVEHLRGRKLEVFKYKPKKRFRSRTGFRPELTALRVLSIGWPEAPGPAEATPEPRAQRRRASAEPPTPSGARRKGTRAGSARPAATSPRRPKATTTEE